MSTDTLPVHWQYYARNAHLTDRRRCDCLAAGHEEQLDAILDAIAAGDDFTPERLACFERIPWNRAKKHRRLAHVLRRRESAQVDQLVRRADAADELPRLSVEHLRVEWSLASGETYLGIASVLKLTVGALKMRLSRWRREVRGVTRPATNAPRQPSVPGSAR